MNTSQKIVGNLGLLEIAAMAIGGGAIAYFVFHGDVKQVAQAMAGTSIVGLIVEGIAIHFATSTVQ